MNWFMCGIHDEGTGRWTTHGCDTEKGINLAETNTYHQHISNSKTACVKTERQEVGAK